MKIAALVNDLMVSQEAYYLIKNFNKLSQENDVYCFYNNLSSVCVPANFALMHSYYMNYFNDGLIICTNLENLEILLKLKTKCKKYFYVWNLEWLKDKYDFIHNTSLMRNKDIELIARSNSHRSVIENYCNKKVNHVIHNWHYKALENLNGS